MATRSHTTRRRDTTSRSPFIGSSYARRLRVEELESRRMLAVLTVTNLDDAGTGSLRDAIATANTSSGVPDEIVFEAGLTGVINLASQLPTITDDLTITGPGQALLTLDAGNGTDNQSATGDGYRIFNIDDGDALNEIEVTLSGLTITGGDTANVSNADKGENGGAIQSTENLNINASTVIGNATGYGRPAGIPFNGGDGGGIFSSGTLTVTASTISGNRTGSGIDFDSGGDGGSGGGIFSSGTLTLTTSTISENWAGGGGYAADRFGGGGSGGSGGGISSSGTLTVTASTISGNSAGRGGGGGYRRGSGGDGGSGGGIENSGTLTVTGSTISGNFAGSAGRGGTDYYGSSGRDGDGGNGGGISSSSTLTVNDSTISGNHGSAGGGVYVHDSATNYPLTILNSIVAGNSAIETGPDLRSDPDSTLTINHSLIGVADDLGSIMGNLDNLIGTVAEPLDPLLSPLADNGGQTLTHALLPNSPAIDAGDSIWPNDQRSLARPVDFISVSNSTVGNGADIGAFELQSVASVLPDDVLVVSETPSNLDLSDTLILEASGNPIVVTLTASAGMFSAPADGSPLGVTASLSSPHTIELGGTAQAISTYLENTLNLLYTSELGSVGINQAAIEVSFNDDATTTLMGTIQVDILELPSLTVTTLSEEVGDFDGVTSLREAILYANTMPGADEIIFQPGLTGTIDLKSQLPTITDDLTISGPGRELLILDASSRIGFRIFNIDDSNELSLIDVTLSGLTLTGGRAASGVAGSEVKNGGAIRSTEVLLLTDSALIQNSAGLGQATFPLEGSAGGHGGGIFSTGILTVSNSDISGNTAGRGGWFGGHGGNGGGIFSSGILTVTGSTISGNSAGDGGWGEDQSYLLNGGDGGSGGGIYGLGLLTITSSTISGNSTGVAGLIDGAQGGNKDIVIGNEGAGGGIATIAATVAITSSTITGNTATGSGGGVHIQDVANAYQAMIESTIIAVNGATGTAPDLYPNTDSTLTVNHSLIGVADNLGTITGNVGNLIGTTENPIDPQLGPLADNGGPTMTHALLPGSPAINAGDDSVTETTDQRGLPFLRNDGNGVDIGAFELQPPPETEAADFDFDSDVDGSDFLAWQRGYGTVDAIKADGDATGDGEVNGEDLSVWQGLFGPPLFIESMHTLGFGLENDDVDLADLDGDGDLDAFVTTRDGSNQVWFNDGLGEFTDTGQSLGTAASVYAALGDIDRDGDIDAVVATLAEGVTLWTNDGFGLFSPAGSVAGSLAIDVALADVNRDGSLDIFVTRTASRPDLVYFNDGFGTFTDSGQLLGTTRSKSVELYDLDHDGDLDAFVGNEGSGDGAPNTVWLNDGNGFFTDSGQLLGDGTTQHVALGDLDDDGDIDAFAANTLANRVWLNDGNGNFTDSGQLLGDSTSSHVALADFDLDGDLDAFVANFFDEPDQIWLNDGTGTFSNTYLDLGATTSAHVALGDVDRDGDIDAVVATFSELQTNPIWLNNREGLFASISVGANALADASVESEQLASLSGIRELIAIDVAITLAAEEQSYASEASQLEQERHTLLSDSYELEPSLAVKFPNDSPAVESGPIGELSPAPEGSNSADTDEPWLTEELLERVFG